MPADYDGDRVADFAIVRKTRENPRRAWIWILDTNRDGVTDVTAEYGLNTSDTPDPQDYNGDRRADLAVRRGRAGDWIWYVDLDINQELGAESDMSVRFGQPFDHAAPGDYDADGSVDFAFARLEDEGWRWFLDTNRDGRDDRTIAFGAPHDVPMVMDFNGDGQTDLVLVR